MVLKKKGAKGKKKSNVTKDETERPLLFKEEGQEYCQVVKLLGNCRLTGKCVDGVERLCHIRGSMSKRKKVWISVDDIVLVSLREYEDSKCDVIHRYSAKEAKNLKSLGEIPETFVIKEGVEEAQVNDDVVFGESSDDDEETKKDLVEENFDLI
jgi:translation initiation factor 1A